MEEMDPAKMLPPKKPVTESNVSGPVGMTPMLPLTGMPMSHQPAAPGEPRVPADVGDVPNVPADTVAEPFGSHLAVSAHEVVTPAIPGTLAETAVPRAFTRVEPAIPAELATPLEPRLLPARLDGAERGIEPVAPLEPACCRCCGEIHDGQEDRPFDRSGDRAHDGEPRLDHDGVATRDAVHDDESRLVDHEVPSDDVGVPAGYGEPREFERSVKPGRDVTDPVHADGERDSCCCCCGEHHDFDRATGDKGAATDVPVTDTDRQDDHEDREGPGDRGEHEDDHRPGRDGDEQRTCDDDEDDRHDKDDSHDRHGKGDRHDEDHCRNEDEDGTDDPDSRGDVTPREERPWKAVNERPVTEPESAYAVRQRAQDAGKHTPGETMAPPSREKRLEKLAEPDVTRARPAQVAMLAPRTPMAKTSTGPSGQSVPAQFVQPGPPSEDGTSPSKPGEPEQTQRRLALAPVRSDTENPPPVTPQPVVTTSSPEQDGQEKPPVPVDVNAQSTPAYRTTAVPPVDGGPGSVGNNPYTNAFTLGGTNGQTTAPPADGNVGPDPNVKFDEGQYNQLINVIADVEAGAFNSLVMGDVYLGTELKLLPSGQKWQPALDLLNKGSAFGGSVDTQTTSLGDSLSSFHDALEEAKAVFKNTDDLAAYDATKFTTEYPGFNNGGLPGA